MKKGDFDITVAILIAKKEEFRAFVPLLGPYEPLPDEETGKSSYMFSLDGQSGKKIQVIALFVGGMGPDKSALWASRLNKQCSPDMFVNIGIAGGIHDDVMLGDVVVATQVDNYLVDAKARPGKKRSEYEFSLSGDPYKTDRFLTNILQQLEFSHRGAFQEWQELGKRGLLEVRDEERASLLEEDLIRERPQFEEGHVASGPIVGAAATFVKWLQASRDRLFLALEMESGGIALDIYEECRDTRLLVLKGVSDYGDQRKKKLDRIGKGKIRQLAMQNATRLLLTLLSQVDLSKISQDGRGNKR